MTNNTGSVDGIERVDDRPGCSGGAELATDLTGFSGGIESVAERSRLEGGIERLVSLAVRRTYLDASAEALVADRRMRDDRA